MPNDFAVLKEWEDHWLDPDWNVDEEEEDEDIDWMYEVFDDDRLEANQ